MGFDNQQGLFAAVQAHHELSVPVVESILLSVTAWVTAACCQLYAINQLTSHHQTIANAAASLSTIAAAILVRLVDVNYGAEAHAV